MRHSSATTNIIGLWVLNQTRDGSHIVFDDRARIEQPDPAHVVLPN